MAINDNSGETGGRDDKVDSSDNGSFWFGALDTPDPDPSPPPLPEAVDVAIIGAGYTGLWTAYYLKRAAPDLNVAVFEASVVGFGASGRNGGWCMGWAMGIEGLLEDPRRVEQGLALVAAMQDTVDEVGRVCQSENIDCHFAKGGRLTMARTPYHARAFQQRLEALTALGLGGDDFCWLPPDEAAARLACSRNFGALYTPHSAAVQPALLVCGLGDVVRGLGVAIHEHCAVTRYGSGRIETVRGDVQAGVILRATEGYTDSVEGQGRKLLPLYSMMVATEPLPEALWQEIGLARRETFGDGRRIVIYGQRTQDDRIAFGGRGGYLFGSKRLPKMDPRDPRFEGVEKSLRKLLPMLEGHEVTHRWGGLMGVPRHWRPFVTFDRAAGTGAAGGYTGEGVAASNLAARILVDLVLDRVSDLTELAWVDDVPKRWEPEPLRWLGAGLIPLLGNRADEAEFSTGQRSRLWGGLFDRVMG